MRKVLLVDDEKYISKGLRAIIERAATSFDEIYDTSNSLEALQLISREKFDLVVLDIRMPEMDGIMLLKEAQKLSVKPKFIILSGYDDFHYAADCIKYGVKAYLLKPVKREELIETLKQVELELSREEELNSAKQKKDILLKCFRVDELNFIFLKDSFSETEVGEILRTLELDILDQEFQIGILSGAITNLLPVSGNFYTQEPGWIIMDAEISPDGNDLYYANAYFTGNPWPAKSDLGLAQINGADFNQVADVTELFKNINTSTNLEYAPSSASDQLELFFTRHTYRGYLYRQTRLNLRDIWTAGTTKSQRFRGSPLHIF